MSIAVMEETNVIRRIEKLPIVTSHKKLLVILAFVWIFEQADLNTFALSAPALIHFQHFTVKNISAITSIFFVGSLLGAWIGGVMADRLGRKKALAISLLIYGLSSLVTTVVSAVPIFMVLRFFTGVGCQAMSVIGITYIGEIFPRDIRGRIQSLILAISVIGIPGMAWFARLVIPTGHNGWRYIYLLGAVGLVLLWFLSKNFVESPRWLEINGRDKEASEILNSLEHEARVSGRAFRTETSQLQQSKMGRASFGEMFASKYLGRTVTNALLWIGLLLAFYGFQAWVPTLLYEKGYSLVKSVTFSSIISLGTIPGSILAWPFIDRYQRRWGLAIISVLLAGLSYSYGVVGSVTGIMIVGMLVQMLMFTATAYIFAYTPEVFPTRIRGTANGFGNGLGRLAVAGGAFIIGGVYATFGYSSVFVFVSICWLANAVFLTFFGVNTKNRSLEEIAD